MPRALAPARDPQRARLQRGQRAVQARDGVLQRHMRAHEQRRHARRRPHHGVQLPHVPAEQPQLAHGAPEARLRAEGLRDGARVRGRAQGERGEEERCADAVPARADEQDARGGDGARAFERVIFEARGEEDGERAVEGVCEDGVEELVGEAGDAWLGRHGALWRVGGKEACSSEGRKKRVASQACGLRDRRTAGDSDRYFRLHA